MRTLCLYLHQDAEPSVAEHFLKFSPRIHYRSPGLVFIDVTSTAKLFGGENQLMNAALSTARQIFPTASGAISDTPWGAQALLHERPESIIPPRCEIEELSVAPLSLLHHFEGLVAWRSAHEIERIIDFFYMLGLNKIGQIRQFEIDSFRQRWGEVGTLIWKRLHGIDQQIISPLLPTEALKEYAHLDFPISLLPFLLHRLEKMLQHLIARLQGRGEYATKIIVRLFCEYSAELHTLELQPTSPGRQFELFVKLLENKLTTINLDNPIQQIEVEVIPCPEKIQQLSFFEPRISDREKLSQLMSLLQQSGLTTGFLQPKDEVLPEKAWTLTTDFKVHQPLQDSVTIAGESFQIRPAYSAALSQAPRPSRLLIKPRALNLDEVKRLNFLSTQPIERLEDSWWDCARGRDYYFALSPKGEFVWLFYDQNEKQYYLHGFFD